MVSSYSAKLPPPKYFNLLPLLALVLHFIFPIRRVIQPPNTYFGLTLILFGILLNYWSVRQLNKENTTIDFHESPNRLVVSGPFKVSRNPVYLSGVILLFGEAILLGSLITFVVPVALFLTLDRLYIPSEEMKLEKIFGKEYLDYKQRVRKWI